MSATTNPTPAVQLPHRILMRAEGIRRSKPRRKPKKPPAGECVRCGHVGPLTKDHIVPQSRLAHAPEVRDDPANWQWMCKTEIVAHAKPGPDGATRYWVRRYGCNETKGDGPAVDHRGDPDAHRRLLALLAEHEVDEGVEWAPRHS